MSEQPPPRTARSRPRPVSLSGPSLGELAAEGARAWLVALIESRPLSDAHLLEVEALAREGPEVCEAVLRALDSDDEFEWLTATSEGAHVVARAVRLAGSADSAAVVASGEALRQGLLAALAATPAMADPAAIADRLAHVCSALAASFLAADRVATGGADGALESPADVAPPAGVGLGPEPEPEPQPPPDRQRLTSLPLADPPQAGTQPLWMAALERQLADGARSGRRFVLLLVDVDGADRLRLAQPTPLAGDVLAGVGRAIREQVRRADLLAHEDEGRIWVIAPDAGRIGGYALAERLAAAVERAGEARGAPLTVSIGLSVFPDDGGDAVALTEQAEEQMFAARAAGTRVPAGQPHEPASGGL